MDDSTNTNSASRYSSYSKRHASFSSPREVPLPSPSILPQESQNPFSLEFSATASPQSPLLAQPPDAAPGQGSSQKDCQTTPAPSTPSSPSATAHQHEPSRHSSSQNPNMKPNPTSEQVLRDNKSAMPQTRDDSTPSQPSSSKTVLPTRPFSLPEAESQAYRDYMRKSTHAAVDMSAWPDRYSSASLPIPSQIPFHYLARANPGPSQSLSFASGPSSNPLSTTSPPSSPTHLSSSGSGSNPAKDRTDTCSPSCEATSSDSSSSSSSSSSRESVATTNSSSDLLQQQNTPPSSKSLPPSTPASPTSTTTATGDATAYSDPPSQSRPPQRPVSPFRAPQPPPPRPPRNNATTNAWTAMRRFMAPQQVQTAPTAYPPPEPPVVLPPESTDYMTQPTSRSQPAYVPFLSHAPPPPDSWIEVETTQSEYKLHVRLPGFSREGITLATKRRRILHVVADRWEDGGGHFERRISFGYDADLVQVRAEFDGTMLRIVIPRRASPVTWNSYRSGPLGRA
ncbi:hypothetical protein D9613_000493 [Agrocybe pediades]|uniref:SHSP domain-containing protein n=1 Tax=Agrocybe pediades TaxID=84607 RepID=A0A8H4R1X7_9AGAR|nr:hypothetical protein D9613_000493 [Agrocybe pediades]